ncbi:MAG TPA: hypothetical protein VHF89_16670 [Solirubrobacteraceae bacterium]|nr:hypothetical protein [Solirubrobacteraceae bacterium]
MVRRTLLAALGALLLAPASAAVAYIDAAYRFEDTLAPHYGALPAFAAIGSGSYEYAYGWNQEPGLRGYRFPDGGGLSLDTSDHASPDDYTLSLEFRLDDTGGDVRLIDWSGGTSDDGVYLRGDEVIVRRGAQEWAAAALWYPEAEVVHLSVFRDGAEDRFGINGLYGGDGTFTQIDDAGGDFVLGGELRLFADDGDEESGGLIDGLWLYEGARPWLAGVPSARWRVAPDDFSVSFPEAAGGGARHAMARPFFAIEEHDDAGRVWFSVDGVEPWWPASLAGGGLFQGHGLWAASWPEAAADLAHGSQHVLRVRVVDIHGFTGERTFPFTVDAVAPTGLALDALPATTSERHPTISGGVVVGAGDEEWVGVNVYGPSGDVVQEYGLEVVGGRFSAPTIESLDRGVHTIEVFHMDAAGNTQWDEAVVEIVDPPPGAEDDDPPPPSGPVGPPPRRPLPPRPFAPTPPPAGPADPISAGDVAASLSAAWADRLRAVRLRGLLRGARLPFTSPLAGDAAVSVYAGGRRRVLVARGRLSYDENDRATIALRPTAAARRALRGRRRATLTVRASFAPGDGPRAVVDRRVVVAR